MERAPRQAAESNPQPYEVEASAESRKTLEQLRQYVADGFLLHGSKLQFDKLEPRQANDTNPDRVTGKQFAIYATNNIEIPLFMAMKDIRDPLNRSMHSGYSSGGSNSRTKMYGTNTTLTPGYIYVLPRDTFEEETDGNGDSELISRVPVTPTAVLRVEPDIFSLFDSIDFDLN